MANEENKMSRFVSRGLAAAMLVFGAGVGVATAQSSDHSHIGIGVKAGLTLGVGVDVAAKVAEKANVRVGFNTFTLNHAFNGDDGINVAAQLKLQSVDAHLDWFPFGGGFHISPGLTIYNGNQVTGTASVPPSTTFSLGDQKNLRSDPNNPVNGNASVSFAKTAPSLLIGWGNLIPRGDRRWSVEFEMGVIYSRAPTATLILTGNACDQNGGNCRSIATDPQLQTDLAKQVSDVNSDISPLQAYPVISLGFGYKF
jgi:hypothetical protein